MAIARRRLVIIPLLLVMVAAVALVVWRVSSPAPSPGPGVQPSSGMPSVQTQAPSPTTVATPVDDPIDRVLAVSIDGLNPRAISTLGSDATPTFHRLMREGSWTLNARTEREQTRTLPNHTGMLTGRRVDPRHGGHGVTFNTDNRRTTVHRAAGHYVASVFDVVHDRGGSTALFASKTKFALYQRTWNAHGTADRVGADNGRAKIDRFTVDIDNDRLIAELNAYLRAAPGEFVFLHIALPDETGHDHGFMGTRYLAAVQETDRLLGSVLDTIAADPRLRPDTLVLVTADHGGQGGSHSDPSRLANYRVPFFAWGPGVAAGGDLYDLNPERENPGEARSSYAGRQPIRNGDLANLATGVLGLPKVPGSQFDADQDLVLG